MFNRYYGLVVDYSRDLYSFIDYGSLLSCKWVYAWCRVRFVAVNDLRILNIVFYYQYIFKLQKPNCQIIPLSMSNQENKPFDKIMTRKPTFKDLFNIQKQKVKSCQKSKLSSRSMTKRDNRQQKQNKNKSVITSSLKHITKNEQSQQAPYRTHNPSSFSSNIKQQSNLACSFNETPQHLLQLTHIKSQIYTLESAILTEESKINSMMKTKKKYNKQVSSLHLQLQNAQKNMKEKLQNFVHCLIDFQGEIDRNIGQASSDNLDKIEKIECVLEQAYLDVWGQINALAMNKITKNQQMSCNKLQQAMERFNQLLEQKP